MTERLTKTQLRYLAVIRDRGHLRKGWGGYSSTLTVRILEERGYCRLRRLNSNGSDWEASLAAKGYEALSLHEGNVET